MYFDEDRYALIHGGRQLRLSRRGAHLARFLAARPGHVRTRNQIIDEVYGVNWALEDRSVDSLVKRLRRRTRATFGIDPIEAVPGIGYVWRENIGEGSGDGR